MCIHFTWIDIILERQLSMILITSYETTVYWKINVFSFKMYFYSSVTRWRRNSRYPSIIRKISIGIRVRLNTATHGLGFVISWHCIKIFLQFMKSIDVSSHFLLQECIMCTKKYQCCVGTKTTLAFINVYMWLKNRFSLT